LLEVRADAPIVRKGRSRELDDPKQTLVPRHCHGAGSGRRRAVTLDEGVAARGRNEEEVALTGFATVVVVTGALAHRNVTRDSLLPGSVEGFIFLIETRCAVDWLGRPVRDVECPSVDVEHDCALRWQDLGHHCDRKHTTTPEKHAVATDGDPFTTFAHKLDERPDSSPPWFQYRVVLGLREQFPNPFAVVPARSCRSTHSANIAVMSESCALP
jgi:hypothetical protein